MSYILEAFKSIKTVIWGAKKTSKDAREKMQLRNIKALDIVESEVKRMMPPANTAGTIELDDRDDETTME